MYWCARELGLSPLAALLRRGDIHVLDLASLHLHSGHLWVLGFVYVPVDGRVALAERDALIAGRRGLGRISSIALLSSKAEGPTS